MLRSACKKGANCLGRRAGSAHLKVLALALVDGGWVACGTGAEVILGGCEPVDDCRAPCDCDFLDQSVPVSLFGVGIRGKSLWGEIGASKGKQKRKKGHTIDGANGETQPAVLVPVEDE